MGAISLRVENIKFCENCLAVFNGRTRPDRLREEKRYCSPRCRKVHRGIIRICKTCSNEFERYDRRWQANYCSRGCYEKDHVAEVVTLTCVNCSEVFKRKKCFDERAGVDLDRSRFCTRKCAGQYLRGENSPFYLGNRRADRGPFWKEAKLTCITRRVKVCRFCDGAVVGRNACVDHIIPYRLFERTESGLRLSCHDSNLWLLCRGCHAKKTVMERILYREGINAFTVAVQALTKHIVIEEISVAFALLPGVQ